MSGQEATPLLQRIRIALPSAVTAICMAPSALAAGHEAPEHESSEEREATEELDPHELEEHADKTHVELGELYPNRVAGKVFVVSKWLARRREEGVISRELGVGFSYERLVVPNWFELEFSAAYAHAVEEVEAAVPVDVIFKKPFELSHSVETYTGAGPAAVLELEEEGARLVPGLVAVLGTYLWPLPRWGIDLEMNYSALFEEHGVAHEVTWAIAGAYRW